VVWEGYDGGDYEIYFWDGTTTRQLTDNAYTDYDPQIHNGQVVWHGNDGDYEIYFWDGAADLSLHVLEVEKQAQRWEPVKVKVVVRNRGESPAQDFHLDIYQHLWTPPEPFQIGDLNRFISELAPHEGVAFTGYLTYDMDGFYDVYAQVDTDQNVVEGNESNNVKGPVEVVIDPDADIDRDGDVDGRDLFLLIQAYGSDKNDPAFEPLCDFVFDWVVDEKDLGAWAPYFGKTGCPCLM